MVEKAEKCRIAALNQHASMTFEQKQEFCQKIKDGRANAVANGKHPGHFVKHSDKTKKLMSSVKKGKKLGKDNSFYGHNHTLKAKEVMRDKRIKWLSSGKMVNKETIPELLVKEELISRNIIFISQYPYKLGIADFYIPQYNAIIECDGNYWHKYPIGTYKDFEHTLYLVSSGYDVYRFWESEIKESVKKCINKITH